LTSGGESLFGLGWAVNELAGCRVVGHRGGDPGFAVYCTRFFAVSIIVVLCTNCGSMHSLGIHPAMCGLSEAIARNCLTRSSS
jgi:hypothetical protein